MNYFWTAVSFTWVVMFYRVMWMQFVYNESTRLDLTNSLKPIWKIIFDFRIYRVKDMFLNYSYYRDFKNQTKSGNIEKLTIFVFVLASFIKPINFYRLYDTMYLIVLMNMCNFLYNTTGYVIFLGLNYLFILIIICMLFVTVYKIHALKKRK